MSSLSVRVSRSAGGLAEVAAELDASLPADALQALYAKDVRAAVLADESVRKAAAAFRDVASQLRAAGADRDAARRALGDAQRSHAEGERARSTLDHDLTAGRVAGDIAARVEAVHRSAVAATARMAEAQAAADLKESVVTAIEAVHDRHRRTLAAAVGVAVDRAQSAAAEKFRSELAAEKEALRAELDKAFGERLRKLATLALVSHAVAVDRTTEAAVVAELTGPARGA